MAATVAHDAVRVTPTARRILTVVVAIAVIAIVLGFVTLWPSDMHHRIASDAAAPAGHDDAVVTTVERAACDTDDVTSSTCTTAHVRLDEGPDAGEIVELPPVPDDVASLDVGDEVVVARYPDAGAGTEYEYADSQRRPPLLVLALIVAAVALVLGRSRGLGALAGAVAGVGIAIAFVIPAILDGGDPLAVAVAGGAAVVVLAVYLRRGISAGSTVAVLGALSGVGLAGGLGVLAVHFTHLTGRAITSDDLLPFGASNVELRGLLLAGLVFASLGVLIDVALRQVAAVWDVRGGEEPVNRRTVFRTAMRSGREQVASSVSTLVLAYVGAALPVLLVFTQARSGVSDALNSEVVAAEIVRALAGVLGLAAAVPVTTLLATWAIGTTRPERRRSDPRAYRSRHERALWEEATAAAPAMPDRPDRAL